MSSNNSLPGMAAFVALADKAADNAFEVIAQLRAHISDLTRRLAEVEAERDRIKCEVAAIREIRSADEEKNTKLLRRESESISYLNRVIRAALSGGDAALEVLETERDKERHRAEAAEAERDALRERCGNLESVRKAAENIRHWHDHEMPGGDGMVVSADAVRELWDALATEVKP